MAIFPMISRTIHDLKTNVREAVESQRWPDRPEGLDIEITSVCDASCIHCPRGDMDRAARPMNFELFKRLIDEAADLKIPELYPNGYGEILTLRDFGRYLGYISSKSHQFKVIINTNGHAMTDEKMRLFLDHRVHLMNICIDGATAETAQAIRLHLKTDRIESNICKLLTMRRARGLSYPKIRVGMILMPQNVHEKDLFLEKWQGVADYVGFDGFSTRAGSIGGLETGQSPGEHLHPCVLPFKQMSIWADGKVVLCCDDWNESHIVGDFNTESLNNIWHGPALTEARRLHLQGKGAALKICANCNYWRKPSWGAKLWK